MDETDIVLTINCIERDGPVIRTVRFAPLTSENLAFYWEKLSQFPTLFGRHIQDVNDFITTFVSEDSSGNLKANGIVWQIDDVGIIWITDIYPCYQATAHFTFWDRRYRGREELIKGMLRYGFEEFGFHRIVVEVPQYTPQTVGLVKRIGFVREGTLRKAAWYRGHWWNVNIYSMLEEEANGCVEAESRSESAKVTSNAIG